ncbi:hypothetical protein ACFZC7_14370 [Streptomyces massasporeus]|uniref:hypothetical protein n=1 Tax=Streptomyces massasporeus TaxID=67324 RepID=UPI0036E59F4B
MAITGVRARPHAHASAQMQTRVIAECSKDALDLGDYEVHRAQLDLSRDRGTVLFEERGTHKRLDLDLSRGDTIEMHLLVAAKPPGPAQRWSLDLEFTGAGRKWYVPISGPSGSFVLAPSLPGSAPTIQVGQRPEAHVYG